MDWSSSAVAVEARHTRLREQAERRRLARLAGGVARPAAGGGKPPPALRRRRPGRPAGAAWLRQG